MSSGTGADAQATSEPSGLTPHDLVAIEVTYKTEDRYGDPDAEPNYAYAQHVHADIEGLLDDYERRVPLGSVTLARIDVWEAGDEFFDVLDAESTEWASYASIFDTGIYDEPQALLIVCRAEVVPWARGYGIGLNAVARAVRTWGEDALVALTAFPPGGSGPKGKAGGEKLCRYWSQLGLKRLEGSQPPLLVGDTDYRDVDDAVRALSIWNPPQRSA